MGMASYKTNCYILLKSRGSTLPVFEGSMYLLFQQGYAIQNSFQLQPSHLGHHVLCDDIITVGYFVQRTVEFLLRRIDKLEPWSTWRKAEVVMLVLLLVDTISPLNGAQLIY